MDTRKSYLEQVEYENTIRPILNKFKAKMVKIKDEAQLRALLEEYNNIIERRSITKNAQVYQIELETLVQERFNSIEFDPDFEIIDIDNSQSIVGKNSILERIQSKLSLKNLSLNLPKFGFHKKIAPEKIQYTKWNEFMYVLKKNKSYARVRFENRASVSESLGNLKDKITSKVNGIRNFRLNPKRAALILTTVTLATTPLTSCKFVGGENGTKGETKVTTQQLPSATPSNAQKQETFNNSTLSEEEQKRASMKEEAIDAVVFQVEDSISKGLAYGQEYNFNSSALFGNLSLEDQIRITLNYYLMKNRDELLKEDSNFFASIYKGQGQTASGVRDDIFDYMNVIAFDSLTAVKSASMDKVLNLFGQSHSTYGNELEYKTRENNAYVYMKYIVDGNYAAAKDVLLQQRELLINNFVENKSIPDGEEFTYLQALYNIDLEYATILPLKETLGRTLIKNDTEYKSIFNNDDKDCNELKARTTILRQLMLQIEDQLNDDFQYIDTYNGEFSEENMYFNDLVDQIIAQLEKEHILDNYRANPELYQNSYAYDYVKSDSINYVQSKSKNTQVVTQNSSNATVTPVPNQPVGTTVTSETFSPRQMERENYKEKREIDEELAEKNYVIVDHERVYTGADAAEYGDMVERAYQDGYDEATSDFKRRVKNGNWENTPSLSRSDYGYSSEYWQYFKDAYIEQYNSLKRKKRSDEKKNEGEPTKEHHTSVPEQEVGSSTSDETIMGGGDDYVPGDTHEPTTEVPPESSSENEWHEPVDETIVDESYGEEGMLGGDEWSETVVPETQPSYEIPSQEDNSASLEQQIQDELSNNSNLDGVDITINVKTSSSDSESTSYEETPVAYEEETESYEEITSEDSYEETDTLASIQSELDQLRGWRTALDFMNQPNVQESSKTFTYSC